MLNPLPSLLATYESHDAINEGKAFANSNIALVKYWGKRDTRLNLPVTDSLSIHLPGLGTEACIRLNDDSVHRITVDGQELATNHSAFADLNTFLSLFTEVTNHYYDVNLRFTIPIAAGFASSASCYASLCLAMNELYQWYLDPHALSLIARLGSGSACRSIEPGFCLWQAGFKANGSDSFATKLDDTWPELCIGLLAIDTSKKRCSSRQGMAHTQATSLLYAAWPKQVIHDLALIKQAIIKKDFQQLGETAEHNSESMHACMISSKPSLRYSQPETITAKNAIFDARSQGLALYYTQDAGPNLKCLFLKEDLDKVMSIFPSLQVIQPFGEAHE